MLRQFRVGTMKKSYVPALLVLLAVSYVACKHSITDSKLANINNVPFARFTRNPNPINIETSQAKPIVTPIPLTVLGSLFDLSNATNTGSSLRVSLLPRPPLFTIAGGVLFGQSYDFSHRDFYWDLGLKRSAFTQINGYGPPLQMVNKFFNNKYNGYTEALSKPDGVVHAVVFFNVTGDLPNLIFSPTQLQLSPVKKAGSSVLVSEFFNFVYLAIPSLPQKYYYYRVSFKDPATGEMNYVTVIVLDYKIPPRLSKHQFAELFGSLKNYKGKSYSHVEEAKTLPQIKIGVAEGILVGLTPFS